MNDVFVKPKVDLENWIFKWDEHSIGVRKSDFLSFERFLQYATYRLDFLSYTLCYLHQKLIDEYKMKSVDFENHFFTSCMSLFASTPNLSTSFTVEFSRDMIFFVRSVESDPFDFYGLSHVHHTLGELYSVDLLIEYDPNDVVRYTS